MWRCQPQDCLSQADKQQVNNIFTKYWARLVQNRKVDHLESQGGCPRQGDNWAMAKSQTWPLNRSTAQDGFDFWENPLKKNLAAFCVVPLVLLLSHLGYCKHLYDTTAPFCLGTLDWHQEYTRRTLALSFLLEFYMFYTCIYFFK